MQYLSRRFHRSRLRVELPFPAEEMERLRSKHEGEDKITLGLRLVSTPGSMLMPTSVFVQVYDDGSPSFFFGLQNLPFKDYDAFTGFTEWSRAAHEMEAE